MTAPNPNTLWARALVDELAKADVTAACVAPGSRSTALALALAEQDDIRVFSHLDERSAAYFALGWAKRTGVPMPLVCTSGTAAANFHPAVMEADRARVPMLLLTADRPPELRDSGANQTVDQEKLYGDAVRWYLTLPEPAADARKLRMLRTTAGRALAAGRRAPAGPVHLNVPFRKPFEPTEVAGSMPDAFDAAHPRAAVGRDGPYVDTTPGRPTIDDAALDGLAATVAGAERGLVVAGPSDRSAANREALLALAAAAGFPLIADPLSDLRFGPGVDGALVCGGYDSYLDPEVTDAWPRPDVVLRFGAAPTSVRLQSYLDRTDPRAIVVDPAGGWREAQFAATDLVTADPTWLARELADRVTPTPGATDWRARFRDAEARYWAVVDGADAPFEGRAVAAAVDAAPDPATVFVGNSMPVRDLDRFGRPSPAARTVLGNRGASGIDGVTSAALGAGAATDDPLLLVTGDVSFYHDLNGLLAVDRFGLDATVVVINNDGGGIFRLLPVEDFDPAFTELFRTPHGLDFAPAADLYGLEFERVRTVDALRAAVRDAAGRDGGHVVEVVSDGAASHRARERLHERVCRELGG